MKKLLAMLVVCGAVGCGEKDTSCAAVMKHLEQITPADKRAEAFRGRQRRMIASCTKDMTEAQRVCVLDADDLYEALECEHK